MKTCKACNKPIERKMGNRGMEAVSVFEARECCSKSCARKWQGMKTKELPARQCMECLAWYTRRCYASGQIEPPSNYYRRTTCGKHACVQSQRSKRLAAKRKGKERAVEVIDIFIYGKKAIQNYNDLWA